MTASPIRLVVFDMAGTSVDEDNVVYKTLRDALNAQGYAFDLQTVLLHGAGKEKFQALKDVLASASVPEGVREEKAKAAFRLFLDSLKKAYDELEVKTFPGTTELFAHLRSNAIRVALNTGYNRQTAEGLLKKLGWQKGREYDLLVTADDVKNNRPEPDMILLAMETLGITDASQVAKVGDSMIDIEEGKAAGCGLTFGVTTGAQTADQLAGANPDFIIDSLTEIKDKLGATKDLE